MIKMFLKKLFIWKKKKVKGDLTSKIIIYDSLEDMINNLVTVYEREDVEKYPDPPQVIKIKRSALEKIFYMAVKTIELKGRAVESYCLLLGKDDIIEDIVIPEQSVSGAYVSASDVGILRLYDEIKSKKLHVIGWGHSHADFGVFFSGTDQHNQERVFNETSNYIDKDGVEIKFSYGLTVNARRDLYGEITAQFPNSDLKNIQKVNFEIIKDLKIVNKKEISDILEKRVL